MIFLEGFDGVSQDLIRPCAVIGFTIAEVVKPILNGVVVHHLVQRTSVESDGRAGDFQGHAGRIVDDAGAKEASLVGPPPDHSRRARSFEGERFVRKGSVVRDRTTARSQYSQHPRVARILTGREIGESVIEAAGKSFVAASVVPAFRSVSQSSATVRVKARLTGGDRCGIRFRTGPVCRIHAGTLTK